MREYLFSYGTLQKDKIQLAFFGRILQVWNDMLRGYKMISIEIKDNAFLAKGEENLQQTLIFARQ